MSEEDFCKRLSGLDHLNSQEKALALLLWLSESTDRNEYTSGELSRLMEKNGLGAPNSTKLKEAISKTRLATRKGTSFKLKATSKKEILSWLGDILFHTPPDVDHHAGYISESIWRGTRGYLEKVCEQLNGCVKFGFYDAAAVLLRRVVETLIIETYEYLNRESEIKDGNGHYFMMSGLVDKALGHGGLTLGRDSKKYLKELKSLGDRSAHKRNYNAVKNDLDKVQTPLRVVVDELVNMSNLKK